MTAEYALRAMAVLALMPTGVRAAGPELAATTHIPAAYFSKVMRQLVVAGLVHAVKGHGGGFSLALPPREISFETILLAVGFEPSQTCGFGWARCNAREPCPLHDAWSALGQSFTAWARTNTLADVAQKDSPLVRLRTGRE